MYIVRGVSKLKKNNLLSIVASNNIINYIKYLVKYLSCRVFGQAIYKHIILIKVYIPTNRLRNIHKLG